MLTHFFSVRLPVWSFITLWRFLFPLLPCWPPWWPSRRPASVPAWRKSWNSWKIYVSAPSPQNETVSCCLLFFLYHRCLRSSKGNNGQPYCLLENSKWSFTNKSEAKRLWYRIFASMCKRSLSLGQKPFQRRRYFIVEIVHVNCKSNQERNSVPAISKIFEKAASIRPKPWPIRDLGPTESPEQTVPNHISVPSRNDTKVLNGAKPTSRPQLITRRSQVQILSPQPINRWNRMISAIYIFV